MCLTHMPHTAGQPVLSSPAPISLPLLPTVYSSATQTMTSVMLAAASDRVMTNDSTTTG